MKKSIKLLVLVFLAVLNSQCNNGQTGKSDSESAVIGLLNPIEFSKKSEEQVIVDVRTPKEFESGHISDAININFMDKSFQEEMIKLNKEAPVFLYCRSGRRSASAAKKLNELGFKKVYDLEGGILNWSKSNLELAK